ncbi:MAG: type II toxin-antitoxin system HicA family toxin [Methylococcales bacterium]
MKSISGKALCRLLHLHGWQLQRIRGSHHIYTNPTRAEILTIPDNTPFRTRHDKSCSKLFKYLCYKIIMCISFTKAKPARPRWSIPHWPGRYWMNSQAGAGAWTMS